MKIGFQLTGGDEWQAGISHLGVFLHALAKQYGDKVVTCLLAPSHKSRALESLRQIAGEVLSVPSFRKGTVSWGIDRVGRRIFSRDWFGARILRQSQVAAVFGLCIQYRYNGVPTLSWVYDFQHVRMPEMFSLQERLLRDWAFSRTARLSTRIVLMSHSVKNDFEASFPDFAHKARVLKTASYIPQAIYETASRSVACRYQLPERFIYVPNQFWKHKNHQAAFKAIKLLRDRRIKVFVVCSGYQGDNRHPGYFGELMGQVSEWGIRDQIRLLGLIPREHVFQLMRQSVCVLNPSLFEGFGLSVDEARSIGKRLVLSDIPAHREQHAPQAVYFDPRDVEDLASKLLSMWADIPAGPHLELEAEARASLPERLAACAESFMAVVGEAVAG